ncbi:protein phosphatase 2C [Scenedesmus sp. NREL 46B-D3]|nr:protein phosphatase 2C [Scenedesmus sp. NREL 46B-D3]
MGAYLSTPVTDKEVFEGQGQSVNYGGGSMQGWRRTMEDAHIAEVGLSGHPGCAIFGVFDGHGGAEVAKFCQKYMTQEVQNLQQFGAGAVEDCLIQVFHRMDDMLRDHKYAEELEQLKTKDDADDEESRAEGDGDSAMSMDALEMIKRVFQIKRWQGEQPSGPDSSSPGAASGEDSMATDAAAAEAAAGGSSTAPARVIEPADSRVQAGCTAVVAVKFGNELFVANAGDSRGVLCRAGQAVALSEDHKPAHETERNRILNAGGFLSEIGGVCRVNGNLNLSRAIGDLKYKGNVELPAKDQIITAQPDVRRISLKPEDTFFVLACDGVWDVMSNQECVDFIAKKLAAGEKPADAACALLDACLAGDPKAARGVGCDNMTVIVVLLEHDASS